MPLLSCPCVVLLFLVSLFFSFLWWGRLSAPFQKMATNAIFTEMELAPPVILNRLCSTAKKVTVSARWVQFQGQTATASCQEKLGFMVIATLLYYYISFSQLLKWFTSSILLGRLYDMAWLVDGNKEWCKSTNSFMELPEAVCWLGNTVLQDDPGCRLDVMQSCTRACLWQEAMTSMVFMMLFGPKIALTRLTNESTAKRGTEDLTIDCSDCFEPHSSGTNRRSGSGWNSDERTSRVLRAK